MDNFNGRGESKGDFLVRLDEKFKCAATPDFTT